MKYMSARDQEEAPDFYKEYVKEVLNRVCENARNEFEAIWNEWLRKPHKARTIIADELSSKNIQIRAHMLKSDIFKDEKLVRYIMEQYVPLTLKKVVSVDTIMKRVPENYQHAICAMWLASRYVYSTGVDGNEFDFFRFMTEKSNAAHNCSATNESTKTSSKVTDTK